METYESVLEQITSLPKAPAGGVRDIRWIGGTSSLGAARDETGRLEIFLAGTPLVPFSPRLRDAVQYHDWHRADGEILRANRILLPALGHFDHIGAFVCVELLRNDVKQDISRAFRKTEPIIELAVKRLEISDNLLIGLAGELLILHSLVHQAADPYVGRALLAWDGWRRSKRDFAWEQTGVEVKTTRGTGSTHHIQGIHQVDTYHGEVEDGVIEDRLFLVSIGIFNAEPGGNTFSIPQLVDRILARIEGSGFGNLADKFLSRIVEYGSESGFGYDHKTMYRDAPFTNEFGITFCRAYDMSDPLIHVIRHSAMASYPQIISGSVRYTVNLPPVISGQNPINGPNQIANLIFA